MVKARMSDMLAIHRLISGVRELSKVVNWGISKSVQCRNGDMRYGNVKYSIA